MLRDAFSRSSASTAASLGAANAIINFRLAGDEPDEFLQAGIESVGRTDTPAADAEVIGLALEGLALLGRSDVAVRLGDMGLVVALLDAHGGMAEAQHGVGIRRWGGYDDRMTKAPTLATGRGP